jgi:uncharacterized protein YoxC
MGWAEALTALSVAVIAVAVTVACIGWVLFLRELRDTKAALDEMTKTFDRDGRPTIQSLRALIDDASAVVATVKAEVGGIADTSKTIRKRAERTAASIDDRLRDIEALVDVIQEEVEDTVLDIAAALRTTRRGGKLFKRMKRALLRRGRRR